MFWQLVFMLGVVFVLTYDPKSGTIEKYIEKPTTNAGTETCPSARFQSIQFAEPQPCENQGFKSKLGAIVA